MARKRTHSARRKRDAIAAYQAQKADKDTTGPAPTGEAGGKEAERGAKTGTGRAASRTRSASRRASQDAAADGPQSIPCPQCGTKYRVPQEAMQSQITCRNCKRSFFPGASTRRAPKNNQSSLYIALAAVGLVAVLIGVIISNMGPNTVQMSQVAPPVKSVNIGWSNARVQTVVEWAKAVHAETDFVLSRSTEIGAMQSFLGVNPEQPHASAGSQEQQAIEKAVLAALKTDDRAMVFRQFEPQEANLDSESMATGDQGTVLMQLPPREGTVYHEMAQEAAAKSKLGYWKGAEIKVRVAFVMHGTEVKVTSWDVLNPPRTPTRRSNHKAHDQIAAPELKSREFGGQKITVAESELIPLDHLADTPAELRREIDGLIDGLMDLDNIRYNRTYTRLKEIGRPAIPRLLNKMYLVKPTTEEDRLGLFRVISAMSTLSGVRFGYSPADRKDFLVGGTDEERVSALKQWYAWWYENHDRDFTSAIDKEDDESLLLTEEEKAALKKKAKSIPKTP